MPLVVMCGYPSSGKSTWAKKLAEYFTTEHGKEVIIVREEDRFRGEKNDILDDSRREKELRAKVKSDAQRNLSKENVVIVDALNYIKGYRYELFCMSKCLPTRQVTVQCDLTEHECWDWNLTRTPEEQYKKEVFDHIIQRFENPDPQNRWDSPFFSVLHGEELDMLAIYNSLFLNKPPKQNQSTQNKPVSGANFLSSLEKITSDIIEAILEAKKNSSDSECEQLRVPHSEAELNINYSEVNLIALTKLKRQFISLTKNPTSKSSSKIESGDLFVQFLNSQFAHSIDN